MPGLTATIGAFAARAGAPSPAASRVANIGIVDAIGVMLAARNESVVTACIETLVGDAGGGPSSLLLSKASASSIDAAFIDATAAHAFAMDDVAAGCHPSAILMPALLAEAEALGSSGSQMLNAYGVGFEVLVELAKREPDSLHATGWHPTGLLGPVAVAAAVASLCRLSPSQCTHAIGIAASMTGGLQANFGTQTKALHVGRVASAGVLAARLAASGVTSSHEALEHPKGLLRTVSPRGRADVESPFVADLDAPRLSSVGLSIKKYPVCYTTHRVVDAAIDVATRHDLSTDDIVQVDVTIGTRQAAMASHRTPTTPLQARYSVEFAVASGLIARAAGFAQLDMGFVASRRVTDLMDRMRVERVELASDDDPVFSPFDRVVVHLRDGGRLDSGEVAFARGHATRPLTDDALHRKFVDCVRSGGRDDAEDLFDRLIDLAAISDLRSLAMR